MTPFRPTRRFWIGIAVLLATNIVTGLVTARVVRGQDFSDMNLTCLLNWGSVNDQLEEAKERTLPHVVPFSMAETYGIHESNARFLVHYPRFSHRTGLDRNRPLALFCWAVAADKYHNYNVDIPVDPLVWHAFLVDGPHSLPVYWQLRERLIEAGAGRGVVRGSPWEVRHDAPRSVYQMPPLSRPYHPLPNEAAPS